MDGWNDDEPFFSLSYFLPARDGARWGQVGRRRGGGGWIEDLLWVAAKEPAWWVLLVVV